MSSRAEIAPMARAFVLALGVHALVAVLIWASTLNWKPFRQPKATGLTIEAVIVDTSVIREQREEAQKAADTAEQKKQAQERRAEELKQQKEREKEELVERQRDLEIQKEKAQQEQLRKKEAEDARRKKEAADKLQALRLDRERQLEEQRKEQQRELEKVREQAAEAEKQRKLEAEKLKQLEARKQAEAAEQRKKVEEAAAAQQAFQAGELATEADNYYAAIQSLVTQNWLRPPTTQAGLRCTLKIVQIPGGEVISAAIAGSCNGDEATRRSVVAAVERIEALPYRGFEKVFQREIEFIFIYDGD